MARPQRHQAAAASFSAVSLSTSAGQREGFQGQSRAGRVWSAEGLWAARANPRARYITRSASPRCPPAGPWRREPWTRAPARSFPHPAWQAAQGGAPLWLPLRRVGLSPQHPLNSSFFTCSLCKDFLSLQPARNWAVAEGVGQKLESWPLPPAPPGRMGHRSQGFGTQAPTSAGASPSQGLCTPS